MQSKPPQQSRDFQRNDTQNANMHVSSDRSGMSSRTASNYMHGRQLSPPVQKTPSERNTRRDEDERRKRDERERERRDRERYCLDVELE